MSEEDRAQLVAEYQAKLRIAQSSGGAAQSLGGATQSAEATKRAEEYEKLIKE